MNYQALNEKIEASGMKKSAIARSMGITSKVFSDKIHGRIQWKGGEIMRFCECLELTKRERDAIFFTE